MLYKTIKTLDESAGYCENPVQFNLFIGESSNLTLLQVCHEILGEGN